MVSSGSEVASWFGSGSLSANATYPGEVTIKLGTATSMSRKSRSIQPAGRDTLPLLSTWTALARRRIPFGLRGQTIGLSCRIPFLHFFLLLRRDGGGRPQWAVPADRLRAEQHMDVGRSTPPHRGGLAAALHRGDGAKSLTRLRGQAVDRRHARSRGPGAGCELQLQSQF